MSQDNTGLMILDVEKMTALSTFSEVMANGQVCVPAHLRGKSADCLAVAMQAAQWGMNPFAVAQKTHLVSGTLGYEAQLVNAVISSSTSIIGRFHYEYGGGWKVSGEGVGEVAAAEKGRNVNMGTTITADSWVRCGAIIAGEDEITWGEPLYPANITTKNSPLWKTAPKQQAAYLALKYWARLYTPDVIMGVYDKDELEVINQPEKDITEAVNSVNDSIDAAAAAEETPEPKKTAAKPRPKAKPKTAAEAKQDIDKADGKVIEGEAEPKKTVAEQVDELNEKQVKDVHVEGGAFSELMTKANNIANGKDFNAVKDALMSAHKAELVTGAEANKVKSALMASKAALMAK